MRMDQIVSFGILVIIIGFVIVFFGALKGSSNTNTKVAVGGFIGFIPFGFGNDKKMIWFVTALSAVILLVWVIFNLKFGR